MPTIKFLRDGCAGGLFFKQGEVRGDLHPARAAQLVAAKLAEELQPITEEASVRPSSEASSDSPPKRKRGRPRKESR